MRVILGLLVTAVIWVLALTPLWLLLVVRNMANPEGFWQNLVMFGLGFWVLGGFQIPLLLMGIVVTLFVWTEVLD